MFEHLDARWFENWCAVVVDSLLDRVQLTGFQCEDEGTQTALDELWDAQDGEAEAEAAAKACSVIGDGYIIVEKAEDGTVRFCENPPHLVHVQYAEDDPKQALFAAKWWEEGYDAGELQVTATATTYLTLYYPDRNLHFYARGRRCDIGNASAFKPVEDAPETPADVKGSLPVFHFRRDRRPGGELDNVVPLQNALNKLLADMMVAAEFGAFNQRWIIANAELSELKNSPGEVWNIPAGDNESQSHSVGQFEATQLANFITGLDHLASRIAIITRTPKHYLLQAGAEVSGEALLAMEAPLVRKATKYRARLDVTWKQCAAYMCALLGKPQTPDDIECLWEEEHTVQPYTEALIIKTLVEAGMPLATILRREQGWTEDDLDQMNEDTDAIEERQSALNESLLDAAQKKFDQGRAPAPYPATSATPKPAAANKPPTQPGR